MEQGKSSKSMQIHSLRIVFLFGFVAIVPLLAADLESLPPPKRVIVPKFIAVIKVDGELNEPVWTNVAVLEPFYQNDGSGPEREHTAVRFWYDHEALYLGWTCR